LDRGEIRCKLHIVIGEVRQNRQYKMGKPIFELEQMVIEMLVRVDEAGNDGHPAGVDGAVNDSRGQLCCIADTFDLASIDKNKSAAMPTSSMGDGYHVTVLDQDSAHSQVFP